MADYGTNFPPQSYSSIFNLNVMTTERTEDDNGIIRTVSSSSPENGTKENNSPSHMLDCFTSSMDWRSLIILLISCSEIKTNYTNNYHIIKANASIINSNSISLNETFCNYNSKNAGKPREFNTLVEYQGNSISFNPNASDFLGNKLNFAVQRINRLNKNAFISYTSEYVLSCDLSAKYIKSIDGGAFLSLTCLRFLDLSYNMLTQLNTDMFLGLENLKFLNLRFNLINYLPGDAFTNLPKLEALNLSHNNISEMHKNAFDGIPLLQILDLSYNVMKHIRYLYFNNLENLRMLYLDNNAIAIIHTNLFSKNTKLEKLDLSANGMVLLYIVKDSFNPETFQVFNVSNNYLWNLNITDWVGQFSNFKTVIDFNENQFYCNDWKHYLWNLKKYNITIASGRNFTAPHHIDGIICDNLNYSLPNEYEEEIVALHKNSDGRVKNSHNSSSSEENEEEDVDPHRTVQFARIKNIIHNNDSKETTQLSFKYVFIVLGIIATGLCVFLVIDYLLGVGVRQRVTQMVRVWFSRRFFEVNNINSQYVQLEPTSF